MEISHGDKQRGATQFFWRLSVVAIAPVVFFAVVSTFAINVSDIASSQSLATSATVVSSNLLGGVFCQVLLGVWDVVLLCEGGTIIVYILV